MNAVDYVLNKNIEKQNVANRLNACNNVANLECSLGTSHGNNGIHGIHGIHDDLINGDEVVTVDNILYDNYNKKGTKKSGKEFVHSNTVKRGKREINKSNRGVLLRYMKQQAEYINDLDE